MEQTVQTIIQSEKKTQKKASKRIKFKTFQGVFTPTLLTILGVIMYLRGPWVVGNAGVVGAIGIITLATAITFFTALSMSSIVTNIRIKAGGAFSIISQSLGLEAGGAIGIPLYIAQAFAVAMYVFGFREGWLWLFPEHPALLVDVITFLLIFGIANISTDFAFKIQYVILAIIGLSIISICMGFLKHPVNTDIQLFGSYPGSVDDGFKGSNFWIVFAVYFPAVTGIMAGANMSGDLDEPRESIPYGTLAAVILSYFIYVGLTILVAYLATPEELLNNYNILIDKSFFAPIVLAGLLGATFSSALSSLVGAPRILQALGQNNILVFNERIAKVDSKGEPKFAFYFTTIVVVLSLLMRDLNAIAPLLTMFFLITYAMVNVVVLVEQGLGQISFRPTLKIPIIVPLLGAIGCFFVMFIINATIGLISIGLVIAMYVYLTKSKNLSTADGDTRSGMFNSLAEWSAKVVNKLPHANERAWQPNLLVPARSINDVVRSYKTIYNLARPKGSVKILGFVSDKEAEKLRSRLPELNNSFMEQDISSNYAVVECEEYTKGVLTTLQGLKASFFTPNTLFLSLTDDMTQDESLEHLIVKAREYGFGSYLYAPYRKVGLGLEKTINLWLDFSNMEQGLKHKISDINLCLLTAYLLKKNWNAKLNIIIMASQGERKPTRRSVKNFLDKLLVLTRMPKYSQLVIFDGLNETDIPRTDLHIMPVDKEDVSVTKMREELEQYETSILYCLDSGFENAMA